MFPASQLPVSREEVILLLRQNGIVPTKQRVEIAYALFRSRAHMSAEQLLTAVNEDHGESSKATIYNTLKILLDRKLIREVIVDPNRVFYDPNTAPHHHFYNLSTGELSDIEDGNLTLDRLPPPPPGMVAESVDVIIRVRPLD